MRERRAAFQSVVHLLQGLPTAAVVGRLLMTPPMYCNISLGTSTMLVLLRGEEELKMKGGGGGGEHRETKCSSLTFHDFLSCPPSTERVQVIHQPGISFSQQKLSDTCN